MLEAACSLLLLCLGDCLEGAGSLNFYGLLALWRFTARIMRGLRGHTVAGVFTCSFYQYLDNALTRACG